MTSLIIEEGNSSQPDALLLISITIFLISKDVAADIRILKSVGSGKYSFKAKRIVG